jgi:hypothetical protein
MSIAKRLDVSWSPSSPTARDASAALALIGVAGRKSVCTVKGVCGPTDAPARGLAIRVSGAVIDGVARGTLLSYD